MCQETSETSLAELQSQRQWMEFIHTVSKVTDKGITALLWASSVLAAVTTKIETAGSGEVASYVYGSFGFLGAQAVGRTVRCIGRDNTAYFANNAALATAMVDTKLDEIRGLDTSSNLLHVDQNVHNELEG